MITTTRVLKKQKTDKTERVDLSTVEVLSSVKGLNGIIKIPQICSWDSEAKAFVAEDNGTNENGESVVIRIVEAGNLSKEVTYEDKFKEFEMRSADTEEDLIC